MALLAARSSLVPGVVPKISTSFQVLSDLHLDHGQQYASFDFPATAPTLILAGDTGRLVDYDVLRGFLAAQTARFETVLLVLGNHEFFGLSHSKTIERARRLESEPEFGGRLVLLHRRRFDVPDSNVTVLGCSLWSHIPDEAKPVALTTVNDFTEIEDWSPDTHNEEHRKDIRWLRQQVGAVHAENQAARQSPEGGDAAQQREILIVTHHAPCLKGTSNPRYDHSPRSAAFATDLLESEGDWPSVQAWVYGHTHFSTTLSRGGVRVVSNQRGYMMPGEEVKRPEGCGKGSWREFDPSFVLRL